MLIGFNRMVNSDHFRSRNASVFGPIQVAAGSISTALLLILCTITGAQTWMVVPDLTVDSSVSPSSEAIASSAHVSESLWWREGLLLVAFDYLENGIENLKENALGFMN